MIGGFVPSGFASFWFVMVFAGNCGNGMRNGGSGDWFGVFLGNERLAEVSTGLVYLFGGNGS